MRYTKVTADSHHVLRNLLSGGFLAVTLTFIISVFSAQLELTPRLLPHTSLLARSPQHHTLPQRGRDRLAGVKVVMPNLEAGFGRTLVFTAYLVTEPALGVVDCAALTVVSRGERLLRLARPQERADLT
jgi:hypothetical protein